MVGAGGKVLADGLYPVDVVKYVHFKEIEVQIRDGKVTGLAFVRSEEKVAPPAQEKPAAPAYKAPAQKTLVSQ